MLISRNWLGAIRSTTAAMFIPAILLCGVDFVVPAMVNAEEVSRVLVVTGRGDRQVQTNKANIQLGIEVKAATAQAVQSEIARRSDALVKVLRQLNVEKLQTTSIRLNPNYVYENNRRSQDGFTGQSSVSFVVPVDKAGETLDAAIAAGANTVSQLSFIAPEAALNSARKAALQEAVKDAMEQADAVLDVLDLEAKSVRTIQIGNATPRPIPNFEAAKLSVADSVSTPVIGGEQNVEAFVTLEINY